MVTNNKLEIFENFEIDRNLPKYTKSQEVELTGSINQGALFNGSGTIFISNGGSNTSFGTVGVPANTWGINFDESTGVKNDEMGWLSKWIDSFRKKKEDKKKTMTILNFFTSLATSLNDIKVLQDTAVHYEQAIANAAKAGQTALVDRLKSRLESAKSELQLVNAGLNRFFMEEQVVDFYVKTSLDKNLKLTWIKHFVKPIPSKILEVKEKLDQQFVFDNYVILHYDPNNDATSLTAEEEIRKKDPIIFGVINGSRRLYYVGDWIDDYCDLTLDVVVEVLKEKVNEVNNEKVKTYLDTGLRTDTREKLPEPSQHYVSGTTFQNPSFFEEVKETVVEKIVKPFTRKRSGIKPATKPMKTSSAEKLRNLGKKKNGSK